MALAQLPVVFLFATKNSVLSLLLGPGHGYEKLNYVHRWSGRGMFLAAVIHGSLWIRNHRQYHLAILGPQKETSGVAAFSLLCIIVLSSLKPVRIYLRQIFFYVQYVHQRCVHRDELMMDYQCPDIRFVLRHYLLPHDLRSTLDLPSTRLLRPRLAPATVPLSHQGCHANVCGKYDYCTFPLLFPHGFWFHDARSQINIDDCDGGWEAGQHIQLRIFFEGRVSESHPLTIANAPASTSCLAGRSIVLGARVMGDWTRALNQYASAEQKRVAREKSEKVDAVPVPVHVMIDGPYGGCSLDLGEYESVLLVAGGAGVTFTLGLLDDLVGRVVRHQRGRGERTRRIEFAWAIRSFGKWISKYIL
jgi:ferric-chelate reductase